MSMGELFITLVVALIVFGPDKLPELANKLGKLFSQAQAVKTNLTQAIRQKELEWQLEENVRKANEADKSYHSKLPPE